jgi:hypothetical protein
VKTRLWNPIAVVLGFYVLHLVEESLTGMSNDPLIVAAYALLAHLGGRHAAYLVFQITWALGLVMTLVYASGWRGRRLVIGVFALGLLAEAHHAMRALVQPPASPGLLTSLPLPILGALIARNLYITRRKSNASSHRLFHGNRPDRSGGRTVRRSEPGIEDARRAGEPRQRDGTPHGTPLRGS